MDDEIRELRMGVRRRMDRVLTSETWRRVDAVSFRFSLLLSSSLQVFLGVFVSITDPRAFSKHRAHWAVVIVICLIEAVQAFIIGMNTGTIIRGIKEGQLATQRLIHIFLSTVVAFAGFYTLCFAASRSSFDTGKTVSTSVTETFFLFLYFSISTMSTTGLGDIYPRLWFPQLLAAFQMLVAVLYVTAIFAVGITQFKEALQEEELPQEERQPSRWRAILDYVERMRCTPVLRHYLIKYLLPIALVFQLLNIIALSNVSGDDIASRTMLQSDILVGICLIQIIQFLVVLNVSIKLALSINEKHVSLWFLLQSFLANAILFGGIYLSIFLIAGPDSFFIASVDYSAETGARPHLSAIEAIFTFLYFSFQIQTGAGYGDVYPSLAVSRLFVFLHIFVSVLYHVIILGSGLSHIIEQFNRQARNDNKAESYLLSPSSIRDADVDH